MSVLALGAGGCAYALHQISGLDFSTSREHLAPIPVSPKACPYVKVMHAAANNFQRVNPAANLERLVATPTVPWPQERARVRQSLNVLEFSVVASRAHFPARIRERLGVVLASIRSGRTDLARVKQHSDLIVGNAIGDFSQGEYAFGDASDLIGDACGVHLAADPV